MIFRVAKKLFFSILGTLPASILGSQTRLQEGGRKSIFHSNRPRGSKTAPGPSRDRFWVDFWQFLIDFSIPKTVISRALPKPFWHENASLSFCFPVFLSHHPYPSNPSGSWGFEADCIKKSPNLLRSGFHQRMPKSTSKWIISWICTYVYTGILCTYAYTGTIHLKWRSTKNT